MIVLNESNFQQEALESKNLVLVDFWATWCGPCIALTPILEKVSEDVEGVVVGKVNVEESPLLAEKYKIAAVPTMVILKGGEIVETMVGMKSESQIKETLESLK